MYRIKTLNKKISNSLIEFPEGSDFAECGVCGLRSNSLQNHIVVGHKMNLESY